MTKVNDYFGRFLVGSALFISSMGLADTEIIFLKLRNLDGKPVRLEPDFDYAHVAIRLRGTWWHAHPKFGVVGMADEELRRVGEWGPSFSLPQSYIQLDVSRYEGFSYDPHFTWSNDRFYCSELVAKALGIAPQPMHFDLKLWPSFYQRYEGLPGISPGKVFDYLEEITAWRSSGPLLSSR